MSYSSFPLLLQGKSTYKVTMLYLPNTLGFFSKYVHKYSYHFIVAIYLQSREGRHHSPWWVHEGTEAQVQRSTILYSTISLAPKAVHTETSFSLFDTRCLGTRMDHTIPQMSARQSVATHSQARVRGRGSGWHRGAGSPAQHTATHPMLHPSPQRAPHNLGTHWGQTRWAGPVLPTTGPPGRGMSQIPEGPVGGGAALFWSL